MASSATISSPSITFLQVPALLPPLLLTGCQHDTKSVLSGECGSGCFSEVDISGWHLEDVPVKSSENCVVFPARDQAFFNSVLSAQKPGKGILLMVDNGSPWTGLYHFAMTQVGVSAIQLSSDIARKQGYENETWKMSLWPPFWKSPTTLILWAYRSTGL